MTFKEIYHEAAMGTCDPVDVAEAWKAERVKLVEALEGLAGYKQEDGLCWCFDPYTNPNKHDACCQKARTVLQEVQHKEEE